MRKSPTMTPARLEANRRNAEKSTGPRTARGKAQSRMNGLKSGWYSHFYQNFVQGCLDFPLGAVDEAARALLTPEQRAHPVFAKAVETLRQLVGRMKED